MDIYEFYAKYNSMKTKELTATFNGFSVADRLDFLDLLSRDGVEGKFIEFTRTGLEEYYSVY